mmetsp:Transcript_25714/g.42246  ORF Transcript_25714/g.42246 Transcript_25714/m.42246 type:complete len:204 (+) Transcript_25714:147-758(+)
MAAKSNIVATFLLVVALTLSTTVHTQTSPFPIGTILPFAGEANQVPAGWLLCDGSIIDVIVKPQYTNLARFLGKKFDFPNRQIYRLPDLRGRFPMGSTASAPVGNRGGQTAVTLNQNQMPPHVHRGSTGAGNPMPYRLVSQAGLSSTDTQADGYTPGAPFQDFNDAQYPLRAHTHSFVTDGAGGGAPVGILNPYLAINYMIKF